MVKTYQLVPSTAHDDLVVEMRHLSPLRNLNAMHAWLAKFKPDLVVPFELFCRTAAADNLTSKQILLFMMVGFAAGRVYQEANPDAPRDPDGYGG